jgi:multidrug efflux pump subunit AcrA (membrane-fusion protein)
MYNYGRGRLWERGGRGKEATVPAGRYRPTLEHSVKRGLVVFLTSLILVGPSAAQPAPPAVGVVRTERQQITQIDEFIGRIQAVNRVAIVRRVTAFLEKRLFVEGSEVKQGDLLVDGEFVTVRLEGVQPVTVLAIPRAAVLSDQQGDYVYVLDAQNKAQVRRIQLGQSTPSTAVISSGLKEGELVISEGLQRVRAGEAVSAGPASPPPPIPPSSGIGSANRANAPATPAPTGEAATKPGEQR